jgi:hypothetical protein
LSDFLPKKLTQIVALTRPEHRLLDPVDRCFYLGEYTSGAGFSTPTNDVIINLKILPSVLKENPKRKKWKNWAMQQVVAAISPHLAKIAAGRIVVPIPTSKVPGHPDYDDRLERVLAIVNRRHPLEIRALIKQRTSTTSDHDSPDRQDYDELLANCYVDTSLVSPTPTSVILFDDVITEGKHFRVCQHLIRQHYGPDMPVSGLFVARRIRQDISMVFDVLLDE